MTASEVPVTTAARGSILRSDAAQKLLAFAAWIVIIIFFSIASQYFRTVENALSILLATTVNGVLALGVTFVIITAGIDLSIGTVLTLAAVTTGVAISVWGLPIPLGILVGLLTGGIAGVVNGVVISRMKIPPFVATLGMMMIARGLALVIPAAIYGSPKPIYFDNAPGFTLITMGSIVGAVVPILPIPNAVLILFAAALVAAFLLNRTVFGRYTVAIGSNEEATRLSGVNVINWKTAVYMVCGLFAGLGGVLMASRLNSAQPALGAGYELDAIAAVVIGGTSLSGGEGTILGTLIGAFLMSTLTNGLRIMGVPQEWQMVVTGVIVILAVYLDIVRRRGR